MVIDIERIKRLISEIRNATAFILDLTKKPFESLSEADKHAIRYNLIVIAEAAASIAMHLAKNLFNVAPETPIHALRLLANKGVVSSDTANELIKIVRLRHLLVHRYWAVDDKTIYDNIKKNFTCVKVFIERVLGVAEDG